MRRVVREILADEVCDNGASVVLSSHDVTEISESCDHVVIMYAGKILQFVQLGLGDTGFQGFGVEFLQRTDVWREVRSGVVPFAAAFVSAVRTF